MSHLHTDFPKACVGHIGMETDIVAKLTNLAYLAIY